MTNSKHDIVVIHGDGIGPEVVEATQKIIDASGVNINWIPCDAGAKVFKRGLSSGVPQETIQRIKEVGIVLKGPLETPVGYGEKSANVTLRKLFETYANIRPVKEFPGIETPFTGRGVDIVVIRENVEDLYAGIEYMQTPSVAECLKIITRKGCEKIIRTAFEFARSEGRKLVHCATKANIMKLTEGMMKRVFEEVSPDYPEIEARHIIIDNCAHQMVRFPEEFDVIVTTNMNGDILSDLGSGLVGGLGFAPGANLGDNVSIFEAVHGSAPKYAGKNVINPTAMLLSGVMMLRHIKEFEAADKIEHAFLVTTGVDKCFTQDVFGPENALSTTDFTDAIINNLGKTYPGLKKRAYQPIKMPQVGGPKAPSSRSIRGLDIFIEAETSADALGQGLEKAVEGSDFKLSLISSRGVRVYPFPGVMPDVGDYWCCRFLLNQEDGDMNSTQMMDLLSRLNPKYQWTHLEKLHVLDQEQAFSKSQGED